MLWISLSARNEAGSFELWNWFAFIYKEELTCKKQIHIYSQTFRQQNTSTRHFTCFHFLLFKWQFTCFHNLLPLISSYYLALNSHQLLSQLTLQLKPFQVSGPHLEKKAHFYSSFTISWHCLSLDTLQLVLAPFRTSTDTASSIYHLCFYSFQHFQLNWYF